MRGNAEVRLKRLWLVVAGLLLSIGAAACGGDDGPDEGTVRTDEGETTFSRDELPADFPDDFPIYEGADFAGGFQGEEGGISGIGATWETEDSLDDVRSFYDDRFASGAWKEQSSGNADDTPFWLAENADRNQVAYVGASRDDDKTSIVAVIGDSDDNPFGDDATAGPGDGDGTGGELPPEASLSSDFPRDDVPLPDGARVTSSSSVGGVFIVTLYVSGSVADIADDFKSSLEAKGWSQNFETQDGSESFATFARGENAGVTVNVAEADVEGYSRVDLTVTNAGG